MRTRLEGQARREDLNVWVLERSPGRWLSVPVLPLLPRLTWDTPPLHKDACPLCPASGSFWRRGCSGQKVVGKWLHHQASLVCVQLGR